MSSKSTIQMEANGRRWCHSWGGTRIQKPKICVMKQNKHQDIEMFLTLGSTWQLLAQETVPNSWKNLLLVSWTSDAFIKNLFSVAYQKQSLPLCKKKCCNILIAKCLMLDDLCHHFGLPCPTEFPTCNLPPSSYAGKACCCCITARCCSRWSKSGKFPHLWSPCYNLLQVWLLWKMHPYLPLVSLWLSHDKTCTMLLHHLTEIPAFMLLNKKRCVT